MLTDYTLNRIEESSLIPTLRSENLADVSPEFSDLKVGIRELSFPFMQEPTEKQIL